MLSNCCKILVTVNPASVSAYCSASTVNTKILRVRREENFGVLTSQANARPSIEWQVIPAPPNLLLAPPLGSELLRILAVDILAPVKLIDGVLNPHALLDEHRGLAIWPATSGEDCVTDRIARVQRDGWVQAEDCGLISDQLKRGMEEIYLHSEHNGDRQHP
jgi:hypothetical protein